MIGTKESENNKELYWKPAVNNIFCNGWKISFKKSVLNLQESLFNVEIQDVF